VLVILPLPFSLALYFAIKRVLTIIDWRVKGWAAIICVFVLATILSNILVVVVFGDIDDNESGLPNYHEYVINLYSGVISQATSGLLNKSTQAEGVSTNETTQSEVINKPNKLDCPYDLDYPGLKLDGSIEVGDLQVYFCSRAPDVYIFNNCGLAMLCGEVAVVRSNNLTIGSYDYEHSQQTIQLYDEPLQDSSFLVLQVIKLNPDSSQLDIYCSTSPSRLIDTVHTDLTPRNGSEPVLAHTFNEGNDALMINADVKVPHPINNDQSLFFSIPFVLTAQGIKRPLAKFKGSTREYSDHELYEIDRVARVNRELLGIVEESYVGNDQACPSQTLSPNFYYIFGDFIINGREDLAWNFFEASTSEQYLSSLNGLAKAPDGYLECIRKIVPYKTILKELLSKWVRSYFIGPDSDNFLEASARLFTPVEHRYGLSNRSYHCAFVDRYRASNYDQEGDQFDEPNDLTGFGIQRARLDDVDVEFWSSSFHSEYDHSCHENYQYGDPKDSEGNYKNGIPISSEPL